MDGNNFDNNVNVEETVQESTPVNPVPPMPSNVVNEDYIKNYNQSLKKRTQLEVKVGAGILSVVGALFVMAALYFGSMYLDKYWMVIAMFATGGLIVFVSELLIERRLKFFGKIITGLGFGVLYYAAIFAYL